MSIKTAAEIAEEVTPFDGGRISERAPLTWEEVAAIATAAIEADRAQFGTGRPMCDNCDEHIEPDDMHAGDGTCGSCNYNAVRSGA